MATQFRFQSLLICIAAATFAGCDTSSQCGGENRAKFEVGPNGPLCREIDMFKVNCGVWPSELKYLVEKPQDEAVAKNWGKGIKSHANLRDPWGSTYQYRVPGLHNKCSFDLWSIGPDKQEGTDDDITNW